MTRSSPTLLVVSFVIAVPLAAEGDEQRLALERAGLEGAPDEAGAPVPGIVGVFRRATRVLVQGDVPAGETAAVVSLNSPFTNSLGQVGFTGDLAVADTGDRFVWADDGILWHNSDGSPAVLSGAEGTMGIGDAGQFIYSPTDGGDDAVWSHNGAVLVEGDPAPGFPGGVVNIFNSRPQMNADGRAYWVAGFNDAGGTSTLGRVLYTSPTAAAGDIQVVLRSDDLIGGFAIARPSGIGFDYDFSEDGAHRILELTLDTGSTADDTAVAVDGALVAREGGLVPAGSGVLWESFDSVAINSAGHYLFSGDTNGTTTSDEFIAHDATIVMIEGFTLDGRTLTSPASVVALSIDEAGSAVHLWSVSGGAELLYFACEAFDLTESELLLATGDGLDFDGDDLPDATVTDFNASTAVGPGLELSTAGPIYVEVDIDEGAGAVEAIVGLVRPLCMPFLDGFETGNTIRWTSTVP